jgi:hypothetical protein
MQAVKFVVKLYDIPNDEGTITAFDSFGPNLFIGTDKGTILKFLMEEGSGSAQSQQGDATASGDGGSRPRGPSVAADASSIFTTHVGSMLISEQPKKRIARVQHSRSHYLLFVLCARRLVVVDSQNMTQLAVICEGVGSFHVSTNTMVVNTTMSNTSVSTVDGGAASPQSQAGDQPPASSSADVDNRSVASPVAGVSNSSIAGGKKVVIHTITAAEKQGRGVGVYELEHYPTTISAGNTIVRVIQELVLPEPVQSIVEYRGMLCLGLRREYSMLSLKDGDARSILALNNRAPLIALGDGEVFLRLQQNIFAVSMKTMPTAGNSVRRTIHLEYEPECIIFRHPFLFAFSQNCCDVFSLYDNEVVERLSLPGVVHGSKFGSGDTIYAASGNKLWMMRIHSLRSQLAGLIHRYQVSDAFHLLSYQKRSSAQYGMIERDLNVMAAYAHLYHGNATEAMHHFAGLVDARELLRHLPELCPHDVQALLRAGDENDVATDAMKEEQRRRDAVIGGLLKTLQQRTTQQPLEGKSMDCQSMWLSADEEAHFVNGWCAASPHNRIGIRGGEIVVMPFPVATASGNTNHAESVPPPTKRRQSSKAVIGTTIESIWKSVFSELPAAEAPPGKSSTTASSQLSAADSSGPTRMIAEMGGMVTEDTFVRHCRHALKRELGCYLTSTLSTSSRDQRRASEYALLVLCLQSRNYSGAFRLAAHGSALCLQDCYWLLHDAREFRLLVTLLRARGLEDEAWEMYAEHVAPKTREAPQTSRVHNDKGWMTASTQQKWAAMFEQHDASRRESSPASSRRGGTPTEPTDKATSSTYAHGSPPPPPSMQWKHQWNNSLDEVFVAIDHMDNTHLEVLLRERPDRLNSEDSGGNSLLMTVAHYLARVAGTASAEMILSTVAFLLDAGCPVMHVNAEGDTLMTISQNLFSPSFGLFFLSFVSSHCTIRAQSMKYMQDESFSELLLLAGCDPTVWKSLGTWQGYVVNKSQLHSPPTKS